jgi:DnaJ-class molecular chaperone
MNKPNVTCPTCNGAGWYGADSWPYGRVKCYRCDGDGAIYDPDYDAVAEQEVET